MQSWKAKVVVALKKSCGKCVRAILCSPCNTGLGLFKEDVDLLKRAAALLAKWRE